MCQKRLMSEPQNCTDLLFRREVVDDVEELANLLRRLTLDHVGDGLATDVTGEHEKKVAKTSQFLCHSKRSVTNISTS